MNPALPQTGNRPSDKNNFGPRIGFAVDVTGDGKTSVRGGYGIYYGRINGTIIINSLINTGFQPVRLSVQYRLLALLRQPRYSCDYCPRAFRWVIQLPLSFQISWRLRLRERPRQLL